MIGGHLYYWHQLDWILNWKTKVFHFSKFKWWRFFFDKWIKVATVDNLLGKLPKKINGKMWEFFPSGGPPPLPPVWEPHVCEKKLRFIFHFRTLGTFLVFTKMFTFWVVLWFVEVGMGDPPPLAGKNSHFPRFFPIKSTRGPKTKLT